MSCSHELYNRIFLTLRPLVAVPNVKQLNNWAWIIVCIVQANSMALRQMATDISVGSPEAEPRITTIRRWPQNPRIDVWAFYRPILERVLGSWRSVEAAVMLDGVQVFGDRRQIFRLSLRHGNRAIPLVCTVIPGQGPTQVEKFEAILTRAAMFL